MSLVTTISSSALKVGKHKIPKYLYHITPTKNVENIQKKGLQMTEDDLFGEGVFMFDLANLTKFWTKTNNKQKTNFAQTLIDYVTRRSGNFSISIFRIPTKNIPTDALSIRRQDKLFEIGNKYETTSDIYNAYARKEITEKVMDEISIGSPATLSNKFDRKKIPIEYILEENIPAKDIELFGTAKVDFNNLDLKSVLKQLVADKKENIFLYKFL